MNKSRNKSRLKVDTGGSSEARISKAPGSSAVTNAKIACTYGKNIKFENLVALFACAVLLVSVVYLVDRPPINERTDFSVTYIGSRMVYLGLGPKLYDLFEQEKLK